MVRPYSWREADTFLRHCQMVSGLGRPHDWVSLEDKPENVPAMLARVDLCLQTSWAGDERGHMLKAFADKIRPPAPVVRATTSRLS